MPNPIIKRTELEPVDPDVARARAIEQIKRRTALRAEGGPSFFDRHKARILQAPIKPIFAFSLEGRCGVGKSTLAQIVGATLRFDNPSVRVLETDTTNSSMRLIGESEVVPVSRKGYEAAFLAAAQSMGCGEVRHVIADCGARDEEVLHGFLPELAEEVAYHGGKLVIFRPFVPSVFVKHNANRFVETTMSPNMAVVLAWNLAMVDTIDDFNSWTESDTRKKFLSKGVLECVIDNLGILYSNRASDFRMSFLDVAMGDFERVPPELKDLAMQQMDERAQLHFCRWLFAQTGKINSALKEICGK